MTYRPFLLLMIQFFLITVTGHQMILNSLYNAVLIPLSTAALCGHLFFCLKLNQTIPNSSYRFALAALSVAAFSISPARPFKISNDTSLPSFSSPSSLPTFRPSCRPSSRPSCRPSSRPSRRPSCRPSSRPSSQIGRAHV